jgi:hypothetical protein
VPLFVDFEELTMVLLDNPSIQTLTKNGAKTCLNFFKVAGARGVGSSDVFQKERYD